MATVFAFAEARGGDLRKVALEAVTAARTLADETGGGDVHALLVGAPGIGGKAAPLGAHGADVVHVCEHPGFEHANAEAAAALPNAAARSSTSLKFSADLRPRPPLTITGASERSSFARLPAFVSRTFTFDAAGSTAGATVSTRPARALSRGVKTLGLMATIAGVPVKARVVMTLPV